MQTVVFSLRNLISETSVRLQERIEAEISKKKELSAEMLEWADWQGLGGKSNKLRLISRQAVYSLILKLMLYEMLKDQFSLPTLSVRTLKELQGLFENARQATRLQAFAKSFLDRMIENYDGQLSASLSDIASLVDGIEKDRFDLIGRVYEDIIPGEERRKLGEFYTPHDISEFMTMWAITKQTDRVLDPACGSGTFLIDAFYRLSQLKCPPREAVRQLCGIDVNPLAILMSAVNLIARVPNSSPNLSVTDFLAMSPLQERYQAIVCNPPYSRHHELSSKYKEFIAQRIDGETGERISRLSSIYVHFFIHATCFLDDGGRMAFITPSEFLDVNYGKELKRFLLRNHTIEAIILYPQDKLVFPEALTTACITLIKKTKPTPEHKVVFVRLNKPLEPIELLKCVKNAEDGDSPLGQIELVLQSQLNAEDKWSYSTTETSNFKGSIPLRSIARAHRGIATGANEFFTLSDLEVQQYRIEKEFLKPIVASARSIPYFDFTKEDFENLAKSGDKVWLLDVDRPKGALVRHEGLLRYLGIGEEKNIHKKYLTRTREIWFFQEKKKAAPILFTYMSRKSPRFVYNQAGVLTLNNLHTIHPIDKIAKDKSKLKALLCYLNSDICRNNLKRTGRVYGGGLVKLEPREVENLPVLDLDRLSPEEISMLEGLFDDLCVSARQNREDDTLRKIHQFLEKVMKR